MEHPGFFERAGPFSLAEIAKATQAELGPGADPATPIEDVRTLADASPRDLSFLDNRKYLDQLQGDARRRLPGAPGLRRARPGSDRGAADAGALPRLCARLAAVLSRRARYPNVARGGSGRADRRDRRAGGGRRASSRAPSSDREARIGRGTRLAAGAVVGYRVTIGRDCYVGPLATVAHALIGDRVILHSGARIGQDGFGFAMSGRGHLKVPQIGRVVIQNDVEIGANTTIDRGALKDTVIGEGTKIDNLVQIGHNVVVGRHCVIVAHTGISGSTELGDFVVMGGQSGTVGHIKIGSGAQVAGAAHPTKDVRARSPRRRHAGASPDAVGRASWRF